MAVVTEPYAPGTPCWVDLTAGDQLAALDFYRDLFGWQGAPGGVPQVVVEQLDQHFPQAPENPDAWKARVAFSTTALVATP